MAKTEPPAPRVLADSASHLLHRVLQTALDVYVEETGRGALTQRQYAVLAAAAAQEGASQTELVRLTGIDRSTLADMVARMIDRGWLARERSTADARAKAVRLTEEGRRAYEDLRPKVESADARILDPLPASRRAAFLAALRRLVGDEDGDAVKDSKKKRKTKDKEKGRGKAKARSGDPEGASARPLKIKGGKASKDERGKKKKKAKRQEAA